MLIPFDRQLIVLQLCRSKFLDTETLYQTLMFFLEICANNVKFEYLSPILGSQERRTTLVDASLESPWSTFYSL